MTKLSAWFWPIVAVGILLAGWMNLADPMPMIERGYANWKVLK